MTDDEITEKGRKIRFLLTDCDGVLTDGTVYYSNQGEEMKRFSLRDGMGVSRLRKLADVETGILTGEDSEIVRRRAEKLGIREYHPGCSDKLATLRHIIREKNLTEDEIAYIGDDTNDLEIMRHAGLCACPADAFPEVMKTGCLVLSAIGGSGAFREFAEIIIHSKQRSEND